MIRTSIKTTTYEHGDFLVDIVVTGDCRDVWIYRKGSTDKLWVRGDLKELDTPKGYLKIVEEEMDSYISRYVRKYEDLEPFPETV